MLWHSDVLKLINPEIKYGKTQAGGTRITIDGYSYCKHYRTGSKTVWRCSNANFRKCRAKIATVANNSAEVKFNFVAHNHPRKWF
ncbi:uncharacterized protein LOC5565165 [Aedes aegypti]|uniref:Uncharacterized protein n=1 Tax=Aedes aegypti TaxID=7159 RepID=A0A6I8TPC8_AEDAE|nr:uncharacterized protein LOC5565165 [Aedes aegypti]